MSPDLADEIEALNSIYGDDCLTQLHPTSSPSSLSSSLPQPPSSMPTLFLLHPPDLPQSITIKLSIPLIYPSGGPSLEESIPTVLSVSIEGRRKGSSTKADKELDETLEMCRGLMRKVFEGNGGMVCLFEFVEELKEALHESEESKHSSSPLLEDDAEEEVEYERERERGTQLVEKPWVLSDVVTEKKSVFIARAIRVYDPQEAKTWVEELVRGDRKLARATHNIYAFRIKRSTDATIFQDNDDDGETAAGSRLSHLLSIMSLTNILVVVSRWYGGVKLGGDRFRIINGVGRQAIVRLIEGEGRTVEGESTGKKKEGKKR